jgi:hypothetical protein
MPPSWSARLMHSARTRCDIIAINADPLADITAGEVDFVMRRGVVHKLAESANARMN